MLVPLKLTQKLLLVAGMALLAMLSAQDGALAQPEACERYRAELASLNRSGASTRMAEANAARQRAEIERLAGYYRAIGCGQGGFLFQTPPACGPIAGQIRSLQASYQALLNQSADADAVNERRRQLRAAVARACDDFARPESLPSTGFKGGGQLVCVRSCDGGYFPLDSRPAGRNSVASLCRALCPNTEVMVFHAPREGNIEEAVSDTGEPYMRLPNALRYRKAYDPSCSCKKPDETWARALRKAEGMIERRKGDVIVTEAMSQQMANAMLRRPKARRDRMEGVVTEASMTKPTSVSDPEVTGTIGTSSPPAGQAKPIRIIAPDIIPVPLP